MAMQSLEDLLLHELEDLYDAEHQLTKALPKMAKAASSAEVKEAFKTHLEETKGQIARLEQAFSALGHEPKREHCDAMEGLITEGEKVMQEEMTSMLMDSALIGAAARVEHYEISGYTSACTYARALGLDEVVELLEQNLSEEEATAALLEDAAETFAAELVENEA